MTGGVRRELTNPAEIRKRGKSLHGSPQKKKPPKKEKKTVDMT